MNYVGIDTSHWNYPIDWNVAYKRLRQTFPDREPFAIVKVSEGTTKYNDGLLAFLHARDAGFKYISPYHFFNTDISVSSQADTFLSQWDKCAWTMRHAADFENTSYSAYPDSGYEGRCFNWYSLVDTVINVPGILYSSLSWITTWFKSANWSAHPLWLSQPPSNNNYKYLLGSPTCPLPWLNVTIWQRSFYNFLGGYYGSTGGNHVDLDLAEWIPGFTEGLPDPIPDPTPDPTPTTRKSKVIVNSLNIRSGPGAEYPATGFLSYGNIINILESSSSPTAPTEWVRHSRGWSAHHTPAGVYMQDLP